MKGSAQRLSRPSPLRHGSTQALPLVGYHAFHFEAVILSLPDILEEGSGQNRQVEFDVENDEEHAKETAPDPYLQEFARIGHDRMREQDLPPFGSPSALPEGDRNDKGNWA